MRCPYCGAENKDTARFCKKCRKDLRVKTAAAIEPLWQPTLKWYGKMLLIIYAGLVVIYIVASAVLKPYIRKIPKEVTPWLEEKPAQKK
jgi:uncharacterized membrane protein YvbJ